MQSLALLLVLLTPPYDREAELARSERIDHSSYIFEGVTRKIAVDPPTSKSPTGTEVTAYVTLEVEVKEALAPAKWKPPLATVRFPFTGGDFDFAHLQKSLQDKPFLFLARGYNNDLKQQILVPSYNFYLMEKIQRWAESQEAQREFLANEVANNQTVAKPDEVAAAAKWKRLNWLSKALAEVESVKAGQTLGEIEKFSNRGKIGPDWSLICTHRDFPFLGFYVRLEPPANIPRATIGPNLLPPPVTLPLGTIGPKEVISSVSKPWLQWPQ